MPTYAWLGHAGREALAGGEGAIRSGLLALALLAAVAYLPRLVRRFKAAVMISPQRLRGLQAEGQIVVVDVRDAKDFHGETGHVPGGLNLPLPQLAARIEELEPWRGAGVVLICRTQVRSGQAARLLSERGFGGLRVVEGGMQAWRQADYPTVLSKAPMAAMQALPLDPGGALRRAPQAAAAGEQDTLPSRYRWPVQLLSLAAFTLAFEHRCAGEHTMTLAAPVAACGQPTRPIFRRREVFE